MKGIFGNVAVSIAAGIAFALIVISVLHFSGLWRVVDSNAVIAAAIVGSSSFPVIMALSKIRKKRAICEGDEDG